MDSTTSAPGLLDPGVRVAPAGGPEGRPAALRGRAAPLVINTVISATDCDAVNRASVDAAAAESRLLRYELQRVAQSLVPYEHRARVCLRCRIPTEEEIRVLQTSKGTTRYGGLMMCALPWVCPVCAALISERRREELQQLLRWWRGQGGTVFLSTFTRSHYKRLPLKASWEALTAAYVWITKHRDYRALCAAHGVSGRVATVKATEVNWGVLFGWHPHLHVLQLVAGGAARGDVEDGLWSLWSAAADRFGFSVTRENGLMVQHTTDKVDAYVAKWGVSPAARPWEAPDELVKANSKRGRPGHYTPFDLLRRIAETGVSWPAELYQEFAEASYRQHQLQWSRGLKAAAGLGELTDREIAERPEDVARVLAVLSDRDYEAVRFYRQQGQLLEVARAGDAGVVKRFVTALVWRYEVEKAREKSAAPVRRHAN